MTETIPSPDLPSPAATPDAKLGAVLDSMSEAVGALLGTTSIDRFGRAARLCVMGQKISAELVKTVAEAKKIRAQDHQAAAMQGLLGAEGQYIAQGMGDINGYAEEQEDRDILRGDAVMPRHPAYIGGQFGVPIGPGGVPDQVQMQRDLMMMLQGFFNEQKKTRELKAALPPTRLELYDELNQALHAVALLKAQAPDSPHLAVLQKQIDGLVDRIAKGNPHDDHPPPTTVDLVPPELLRGHPPGTGEQWGDPAHPRRPVLHREGGGAIADGGGQENGDHQIAVG
jgi:hypothetical protein